MRQRGRNDRDFVVFAVIGMVMFAALMMWPMPAAGPTGQFGFAPAMAAVMGVFLAVALKRRVD